MARYSLPQKFTLSALAGKLARQVLEVTLGKMRFCRALFTIKALRRKQLLSFRIVTSRYNQPAVARCCIAEKEAFKFRLATSKSNRGAAARLCQVLLDKVILDSK